MKRPPFKLTGSVHAQSRHPNWKTGRPVLLSARSTFVWLHGVLVPLALGDTDVEIRRDGGPWHRITYTPDEAYQLLMEHYPLQRASLARLVASHRRKRLAAGAGGTPGADLT